MDHGNIHEKTIIHIFTTTHAHEHCVSLKYLELTVNSKFGPHCVLILWALCHI